MQVKANTIEQLQAELEELRHQLFEANETIEAIRTGQIDALVFEGESGHELYTLKTADQAYRVFIEKMTEGAVTLNRDGIILYCNSQFASMVDVPLSNVIGVPFDSFIASDDQHNWAHIFQLQPAKDYKEEVLLKTGGDDVPVQLSMTPSGLDDEVAFNIILTDLTAQKRTQKQLEDKNNELELSNNDLQQFASVASHDLQEPLRKIQMFSNLLIGKSGDALTPDLKGYVQRIIDSAGRMKRLIVDVLHYSKLSAKEKGFENVELNAVIKELREDFELIIAEKSATLTVDDLPDIEGNRGQMRQVFQNIISNALKFSKDDVTPVIHVSAKKLEGKAFDSKAHPDGNYCVISIKDNGIGFDEKYVAHIFNLFERLHSKDKYEGTGIGLAITKKIIEKHGGLVGAKGKVGNGAEFILLLPIHQDNNEST